MLSYLKMQSNLSSFPFSPLLSSGTIPEESCKTPLFEEHDEWEPDNTSPLGSYSSGGSGGGRHSRNGRRNNHSDRGGGSGGGGGDNGSIGSRGEQPLLSRATPKPQKKSRSSPGPDASLLSNTSTDASEDDEDYDEGKIS